MQYLVLAMCGMNFLDFAYLPTSSTRGGILIAARQSAVSLSDVLVGCYSLTVKVHPHAVSGPNSSWWLSAVYGP